MVCAVGEIPRRYDVALEQQINGCIQNMLNRPNQSQPQVPSIVCMTEYRNVDLEGPSTTAPDLQAVSRHRVTMTTDRVTLLTDAMHAEASNMPRHDCVYLIQCCGF